jgi:hypothetical protein
MLRFELFALLFLASHGVAADYLCVPDYSVGFVYDRQTQRWTPNKFPVEGRRYVLSEKGGQWTWSQWGNRYRQKCGDFDQYEQIHCEDSVESIVFNKATLRYQLLYAVDSTVRPRSDHDSYAYDTPYIEIGACAVL